MFTETNLSNGLLCIDHFLNTVSLQCYLIYFWKLSFHSVHWSPKAAMFSCQTTLPSQVGRSLSWQRCDCSLRLWGMCSAPITIKHHSRFRSQKKQNTTVTARPRHIWRAPWSHSWPLANWPGLAPLETVHLCPGLSTVDSGTETGTGSPLTYPKSCQFAFSAWLIIGFKCFAGRSLEKPARIPSFLKGLFLLFEIMSMCVCMWEHASLAVKRHQILQNWGCRQ